MPIEKRIKPKKCGKSVSANEWLSLAVKGIAPAVRFKKKFVFNLSKGGERIESWRI